MMTWFFKATKFLNVVCCKFSAAIHGLALFQLNPDISSSENSVDQDQLASDQDLQSFPCSFGTNCIEIIECATINYSTGQGFCSFNVPPTAKVIWGRGQGLFSSHRFEKSEIKPKMAQGCRSRGRYLSPSPHPYFRRD